MKGYFKKRKLAMMVDSFRVWHSMLEMRSKNLEKATTDEVDLEIEERWDMLLSQAIITQMKAIEVIDAWELNVTAEEIERLSMISIEGKDDIKVFIEYLKYLHKRLYERHNVFELNTRLLMLPITKGETIAGLVVLIGVQFLL